MNLLINGSFEHINNIHFEDTLIASDRGFKIDSPDFDSQKNF